MSAALTADEMHVLHVVTTHLRALGAGSARSLEDIAERFGRLRHCDQCGNLFDGLANQDECQHCAEDRRHGEAMEARGGGL